MNTCAMKGFDGIWKINLAKKFSIGFQVHWNETRPKLELVLTILRIFSTNFDIIIYITLFFSSLCRRSSHYSPKTKVCSQVAASTSGTVRLRHVGFPNLPTDVHGCLPIREINYFVSKIAVI